MLINLIKRLSIFLIFLLITIFIVKANTIKDPVDHIDFSKACILIPKDLNVTGRAAINMLIDEVESRTLIKLSTVTHWPSTSKPVIVIAPFSKTESIADATLRSLSNDSQNNHPEGFTLKMVTATRKAPTVYLVGNDQRGVLFGVGYLLRKAWMNRGKFLLPKFLNIITHPAMSLRGQQLGYRPKTNAYDGFTLKMWESYIRDLIVFGNNSVELIPPNNGDVADSPMFSRPPMDMMIKMDSLLNKYDLNAWIWYPLVHGDYRKSNVVKESLKENKRVFSALSRITAVFIPGGDPGHQSPSVLFNYAEKEAKILHKYHPDATIWVSPQGFNGKWMDSFFQLVNEKPAWLGGIVYGPQLSISLGELRKKIPASYSIRRYPDITHNYGAQYPVPDWDHAYAATENRESINPRPKQEAAIFRSVNTHDYQGFITYSEGVNDDINKMIWSGLGWNPKTKVQSILQDYARYFIGSDYATDFAQGVMDLEHNWQGSLLANKSVSTTLLKFKSLERQVTPFQRLNWRFQEVLYRAYYDAYDQNRLLYENDLEDQAIAVLRMASQQGTMHVMEKARAILDKALEKPVSQDLKNRIYELAEALFQSIHMQKSVPKYYAKRIRRGANLDLIDFPLNDRLWLEHQFDQIEKLKYEKDRLAEIKKITNWKNPGAGGFYDDLGDPENESHLVKKSTYKEDPSFLHTPFLGFTIGNENHAKNWRVDWHEDHPWRVSWSRYVQSLHDTPLKMHYTNLDTTAQYKIKVVYSGDHFKDARIHLMADGEIQIHDYLKKPFPIHPLVFDIPQKATKDGVLNLRWNQKPGQGGNGRGCQVAEVWLMKKKSVNAGLTRN